VPGGFTRQMEAPLLIEYGGISVAIRRDNVNLSFGGFTLR
jgi:hypothetical protein